VGFWLFTDSNWAQESRADLTSFHMFRLTKEEKLELVTNCDRLLRLKHSSAMPRAFTEQGIGGDVTGKVAKGMLVLHGKCTRCGGAVARVIENEG
jgi:hypothetical protein